MSFIVKCGRLVVTVQRKVKAVIGEKKNMPVISSSFVNNGNGVEKSPPLLLPRRARSDIWYPAHALTRDFTQKRRADSFFSHLRTKLDKKVGMTGMDSMRRFYFVIDVFKPRQRTQSNTSTWAVTYTVGGPFHTQEEAIKGFQTRLASK